MFRFSQAPLSRREGAIQSPDDLHTLHYVLVVDGSALIEVAGNAISASVATVDARTVVVSGLR